MSHQGDLSEVTIEARSQRPLRVVEDFVDTLFRRAGRAHGHEVAHDRTRLDGREIDQSPERFVEDELIARTAEVLGYDVRFRPKGVDGLEGRIPKFTVLNLAATNLGEVKTPGSIESARKESVDYLETATDRPLVGFATDGFVWVLYASTNANRQPVYSNHETLHTLVRRAWTERAYERATRRDRRVLRGLAHDFVREFSVDSVRRTVAGES